ncbi:hypothetical protein BJ875DRAFT_545069 [Amylocarpus encephaloides]|uniref:Uncharacterized protein n=1 Tax=Amylocarpus encephaloides TaxID=45428 RepID=A0A9P7YEF2_9HELO|nr:hypothetical protein BJ875DRAFT_545069 [Amylocarpus encephaloides]
MVLLTSSQVSVAISSAIVVSFTSALFLSGYVLQQATLRDLRAAIKPQMVRPLPELQINLQSQYQNDNLEQRTIADATSVEIEKSSDNQDEGSTANTVETRIQSTIPDKSEGGSEGGEYDDMIGATRWQKEKKRKERLLAEQQKQQRKMNDVEGQKRNPVDEAAREAKNAGTKLEEKPMSRAERRKKIKEEILADGEGEEVQGYRRRMW